MTETTSRSATGTGKQLAARETHGGYGLDVRGGRGEEPFGRGNSFSMGARRYNVNSNLVFTWRKRYREGTLGSSKPAPRTTASASQELIRIGVIDPSAELRPLPAVTGSEAQASSAHCSKEAAVPGRDGATAASTIDIELPNRVRVRVDAGIGDAVLRRVLAAARQLA